MRRRARARHRRSPRRWRGGSWLLPLGAAAAAVLLFMRPKSAQAAGLQPESNTLQLYSNLSLQNVAPGSLFVQGPYSPGDVWIVGWSRSDTSAAVTGPLVTDSNGTRYTGQAEPSDDMISTSVAYTKAKQGVP